MVNVQVLSVSVQQFLWIFLPLCHPSVRSAPKKGGRPTKKRVADAVKLIDDGEFDLFSGDDSFWENHPLEHDAVILDLLDMGVCSPVSEMASLPLPPPEFLLSILLSEPGASAFIARATDIAASIGLQLEGLLWALVRHDATHCGTSDLWEILKHSIVVAHSAQVKTVALGKNLADLMTGNDITVGAEFLKCALQSDVTRCSIGTILMNHTLIRANGESVSLHSSYVFYNEHGNGRFQFIVGAGGGSAACRHLPVIGTVVPAPKVNCVLRSILSNE